MCVSNPREKQYALSYSICILSVSKEYKTLKTHLLLTIYYLYYLVEKIIIKRYFYDIQNAILLKASSINK